MSTRTVNHVWGVLYPENDSTNILYLTRKRNTLGKTSLKKLTRSNERRNSLVKKLINQNQKLFIVSLRSIKPDRSNLSTSEDYTYQQTLNDRNESYRKYVQSYPESNEIIISPAPHRVKGVYVDGVELTKDHTVVDGKSNISVEGFDCDLIFEAFCDTNDNEDLGSIGHNYRYISKLGAGAYGTVYKGFKLDEKIFCAIKVETYQPERLNSTLLHKEFVFIRELDHPNIFKWIDYQELNDRKYLVTELAEGGTLSKRIKGGGEQMDEMVVKHIFRQLFSAVDYLHKREIIHRDIKPMNIVHMTPEEYSVVKLIDFGLCCHSVNHKEIRRVAGTVSYMAPEILHIRVTEERLKYNEKVDVWSLGVCLFYALTNVRPFTYDRSAHQVEEYRERVLNNEMNIDTPLYDKISAEGKEVVLECLEIREPDRPTASEVLGADWFIEEQHIHMVN